MATASILVGTEDDNGVGLYSEVDDSLGAGTIAGSAADTLVFVDFGYAVGIDINGTEAAHINTGTATGTAVMTQIGAVFLLFGTATTVTVNTGYFLWEFFLYDHGGPPLSAFVGGTAER